MLEYRLRMNPIFYIPVAITAYFGGIRCEICAATQQAASTSSEYASWQKWQPQKCKRFHKIISNCAEQPLIRVNESKPGHYFRQYGLFNQINCS